MDIPNSHLGTLYPFIQRQADRSEHLLNFLRDDFTDVEAWKIQGRAKLLDPFHDYLCARPEVDPARIGCVGLSVGGYRSAHLAALDGRIKIAVVVGWMSSYGPMIRNHIVHSVGLTKVIPGMYPYMDLPDIVSMAAPNALMVIHGSKDSLFPPEGVERAFAKIAACYAKVGAPDRFRSLVYDGPHEFNLPMQAEAFAWLDRWLLNA